MAVCRICNREMTTAKGCGVGFVLLDGKRYERIRRGSRRDLIPGVGRCFDCGARRGQYHHSGCDAERCPACGGQMFICDCDVEFLTD